jgi:response regulator of citrate/malate metabolism
MKRDPLEIVEELFEALEKAKVCSINELAQKTGIHNITIRKYIKLIEIVRREPEFEIIRTKHSIILRVK